MRPTLLTVLRSSRAALWAVLVSFGLLQAAVAGHAGEHALEDVGESCEFCLKHGETKTPVTDSGADGVLPQPGALLDAAIGSEDAAATFRKAPIRAPPLP